MQQNFLYGEEGKATVFGKGSKTRVVIIPDWLEIFWLKNWDSFIEILSKLMYLFEILKTESDKLIIEVVKTSLTEITGLSTFNQGGRKVCFI